MFSTRKGKDFHTYATTPLKIKEHVTFRYVVSFPGIINLFLYLH